MNKPVWTKKKTIYEKPKKLLQKKKINKLASQKKCVYILLYLLIFIINIEQESYC